MGVTANPGVDTLANIGRMSRKTQSEVRGDRLDALERYLPADLAPGEQFICLVESFGQKAGELLIDLHIVPRRRGLRRWTGIGARNGRIA
jgi:hypothetical protein